MPKKGSKLRTPRKPVAKLSRQRRWQIKKKKEGCCIICGKPRTNYAQHCDLHWRQINGFKPWHAGGKGRPPHSSGAKPALVII